MTHLLLKILVVDDDSAMLNVFKTILEPVETYFVDLTNAGDKAYAALEKIQYDIIITDLIMPDMSGMELIKKVKRLPQYTKTPILVVSSDSSKEAVKQAVAAGVSGWIVKPVTETTLLPLLEKTALNISMSKN